MKLLIAEDEKIEREALKYLLKKNFPEIKIVGEATNGLQAVEMNNDFQPDVILMDIRMGIMDGLTAAERIRNDNPLVQIIILTAFGRFDYSQQAIRLGVFDYLLKPIEEKELLCCIGRVYEYIDSKKEEYYKFASGKLFDYWAMERTHKEDVPVFECCEDKRISMIIKYIMENLDKDISLEELASMVHTSPGYLSRLFKHQTGIPVSKFILEARIEKAKFLLLSEKDLPLKSIAEAVGFTTVQHFCNTFKKVENITPSNFRRRKGRFN